MEHFVLGFMFSQELDEVALIHKLKPTWQAGLLNGIGGKIEEGETARKAIVREFYEEAGFETLEKDWTKTQYLSASKWEMFVFSAMMPEADLGCLRSMEAEKIEIVKVGTIHPLRTDMIDNLPWLIAHGRWRLLSARMEDGQ